jgi:hypothetical protein
MQGHEVGVVMHNHRIVSNGRGGDEDVLFERLARHVTPASWSWLDLVGRWFGDVTDKGLVPRAERRCTKPSKAVQSPSITADASDAPRGW